MKHVGPSVSGLALAGVFESSGAALAGPKVVSGPARTRNASSWGRQVRSSSSGTSKQRPLQDRLGPRKAVGWVN